MKFQPNSTTHVPPHLPENDLIAFHIGEEPGTSRTGTDIRDHLEICSDCAALSESIAETLRVFSAEPVPQPDLDRAWQRLSPTLPAMSAPAPRSLLTWPRAAATFAAAAAVLLAVFLGLHLHRGGNAARSGTPEIALGRPGPLTAHPVDPAIANHLDSAERLLTEVNHASGPLDDATRSHAHDLLLKNAVYMHKAYDAGDLADASVLENLGRVLTTLDHKPSTPDTGWHLRFEMNTDGLLLDIRILRQNDSRQ